MDHQERLQRIREVSLALEEAEERLMIADGLRERWDAGRDYDLLVAELDDLREYKPYC